MTSVIVPPVDLAPGMPSRVVTISATDVTEGGTSMAGQMVRFALSDTLDVTSGGDVIAKTQAEVVLDSNGEGRIRLPVYTDGVKTWCGDPDWAILVTATWGSQKAIRVPAGTSSIALSALPPVRPLRGREKQWAITGVNVSASIGDPSTSSGSFSGGILGLDLKIPAGIWSKRAPAGANFDEYYTDTHSGHWTWSLAGVATLAGLPTSAVGKIGSMLVLGSSTRVATQIYIPYGYYDEPMLTRSVKNITTMDWSEWEPLGGATDPTINFSRGTVPLDTNLDDWWAPDKSGLWHFSIPTAVTMSGLPSGAEGRNGQVLIMSSGVATQMYLPYGYYGESIQVRSEANAVTHTWTEWSPLGGSAVEGGIEPMVQNAIRKTQFLYAMGGPIDTGGLGAVSLRCDHGLANFASKVLPVTSAMGMKVSQAYNPRNWHYAENQGVTATDLNGWVAAGDVEIWNHSANHLGAESEAALYDQIVNGLAEIEAELPAARGKVWGFAPPGVSSGDYMGFGNGAYPESWDGPAGRLILKHHAVGSAYMTGTRQRILDGVPRDAESHYGLDSSTVANAKAQIDQAIENRTGLQLFLHPSQLDLAGKMTTAQFEEVMAYIVQKRDAGVLAAMSPYEMAVADSTLSARDVGDLDITSSLSDVASGKVYLTRIGQQVWLDFQDTKITEPGSYVQWDAAIPNGYRPHRFVDLPLQGRASSDTAGPVRVAPGGQIVIYKPAGTVRGLVSWITRNAPPA